MRKFKKRTAVVAGVAAVALAGGAVAAFAYDDESGPSTNGVTTTRVVEFDSSPAAAYSSGSAQVECPEGTTITGGGFVGGVGLYIDGSVPGLLNGLTNGWRVYYENQTASPEGVYVYALCAE